MEFLISNDQVSIGPTDLIFSSDRIKRWEWNMDTIFLSKSIFSLHNSSFRANFVFGDLLHSMMQQETHGVHDGLIQLR